MYDTVFLLNLARLRRTGQGTLGCDLRHAAAEFTNIEPSVSKSMRIAEMQTLMCL